MLALHVLGYSVHDSSLFDKILPSLSSLFVDQVEMEVSDLFLALHDMRVYQFSERDDTVVLLALVFVEFDLFVFNSLSERECDFTLLVLRLLCLTIRATFGGLCIVEVELVVELLRKRF